jgi:GNAT superfamily N-acetyltransferase
MIAEPLRLRALGELDPDDREEILAADRACFPDDAAPDFEQHSWWVILDPAGGIAAYASAMPWDEGQAVFIDRMGTLPEYRGGGLQRRLVHAITRWAKRHGALQVRTYVMPWNVASNNNFAATGFRMYDPKIGDPWVGEGVIYWRRILR